MCVVHVYFCTVRAMSIKPILSLVVWTGRLGNLLRISVPCYFPCPSQGFLYFFTLLCRSGFSGTMFSLFLVSYYTRLSPPLTFFLAVSHLGFVWLGKLSGISNIWHVQISIDGVRILSCFLFPFCSAWTLNNDGWYMYTILKVLRYVS